MTHLQKKSLIFGAGKKSAPAAPPPAQLEPPKLGKMTALASYSYAETIDLVSDGPIDGFVNQNGQYVQGHRIFESIYFDNTPVKKSININYTGENAIVKADYSISGTANNIYNLWYNNGVFQDKTFSGVANTTGMNNEHVCSYHSRSYFANGQTVTDPYKCVSYAPISHVGNSGNIFDCPDPYLRDLDFELTWERDDISKSIYKAIDLISIVADSPTTYGVEASKTAKAKQLRYNFPSWTDVRTVLLPNFADSTDEDYPFFAAKITFGSPYSENYSNGCSLIATINEEEKNITVASTFTVDDYTNSVLIDDICNQVFQKIEVNEISSFRKIRPLNYIDLTYCYKTSPTNLRIAGSIFVFGYKNGRDKPEKTSLQAIKDYLRLFSIVNFDNEKYNYSNVLAEIRHGDDLQSPLSYFRKVYASKEYSTKLSGPFDVSKAVLRVSNFADDTGYEVLGTREFPLTGAPATEGSADNRSGKDFSSYSGNGRTLFIEEAIPVTHIVENSNVDQVYITIGVRALSDSVQIDSYPAGIGFAQAGTKIPSVVRFKVEIGLQDSSGKDVTSSVEERVYQVVGLAESPVLVDIGRSENATLLSKYKFLAATKSSGEIDVSTPIILPESTNGQRRFVRVTRTTFETSSVLIRREISLEKVCEIISSDFSYPGSAIIGTKIDSRNISAIPPRSYDLRLKRVLVPSNYFPLRADGVDKRRYRTADNFSAATSDDLQVYKGLWDGTFKESWTDNPAWVLFDLLIDTEYGLGSFVEPENINIFELYKIGQFCDAVNKDGVFVGVPNALGGKEPRYSVNIILGDKIDVYQTINAVANVFRGGVFYSNSEINFSDDRLKVPIYTFSNTNVKDGIFSYSTSRRDQEFNVVEVAYIDELDDFKSKVEYVEDGDSIRKRGVLKTSVDSFGVTSKTAANRIGQHILAATTNENESVAFTAGMESMLLKPGDLIDINDELKTQMRNFGRVLSVEPEIGKIHINEKYNTGFLSEITLAAPTGKKSWNELESLASLTGLSYKEINSNDVPQVQTFKITGYDNSINYGSHVYIAPLKSYDLINFTGDSRLGLGGVRTGYYSGVGTSGGYSLYSGIGPTGYTISRSGTHWYMRNAVSSTIANSGSPNLSSPTGVWSSGGCYLSPSYDNPNIEFLQLVGQGSPFSIPVSGLEKQTYRVSSIKGSNDNEFEISAIKFNSGKFNKIESAQNLNDFYGTFGFVNQSQTQSYGSTVVNQLDTPTISAFTTGSYSSTWTLSGNWAAVSNAENYQVTFIQPNGNKLVTSTTGTNYVSAAQNQIGFYRLMVSAKNQSQGYSSKTSTTGYSVYASTSVSSPYIRNIIINQ